MNTHTENTRNKIVASFAKNIPAGGKKTFYFQNSFYTFDIPNRWEPSFGANIATLFIIWGVRKLGNGRNLLPILFFSLFITSCTPTTPQEPVTPAACDSCLCDFIYIVFEQETLKVDKNFITVQTTNRMQPANSLHYPGIDGRLYSYWSDSNGHFIYIADPLEGGQAPEQ